MPRVRSASSPFTPATSDCSCSILFSSCTSWAASLPAMASVFCSPACSGQRGEAHGADSCQLMFLLHFFSSTLCIKH
jgi:hypothetical protein